MRSQLQFRLSENSETALLNFQVGVTGFIRRLAWIGGYVTDNASDLCSLEKDSQQTTFVKACVLKIVFGKSLPTPKPVWGEC